MNKKQILKKIGGIYNNIDFNFFNKKGFYKNKDYAFIYSYPPVQILKKLTEAEVKNRNFSVKNINLYIHIPYCTGKCTYCYFSKIIDNSRAMVLKDEYINLLKKEILLIKQNCNIPKIKTVHIGGGTPSCLNSEQIKRLFYMLNKHLKFADNLEITFECSPETILEGKDKLKALKESGVNRISIGIETLDDKVLKGIKRRHLSVGAIEAIKLVREYGFSNVNVDIMYGLPFQKIDSWYKTLKTLVDLKLESISTYRLRLHPKKEISTYNKNIFPSYEETIKMYLLTRELLLNSGYMQASSHKFSIESGKVQKQILRKRGIKENNILGLGCSSYGFIGNQFYWNCRSINEYKNKVLNGNLPVWIGENLDIDEQARKGFILGVHLPNGIDRVAFKKKFGELPEKYFNKEVNYLMDIGLLCIDEESIKLTDVGCIFADEICIKFYSNKVTSILKKKGMKYGMFFDSPDYNSK